MKTLDCVILAAGESKRFGKCKILESIDGKSLILRTLTLINHLGINNGYIVTGAFSVELDNDPALTLYLERHRNVKLRYCKDWKRGMGHSLGYGVQQSKADALLVLLCDQVLLTAADIKKLINAHHQAPNTIVCAQYGETDGEIYGVPAIFPKHYFNELSACIGDQGARRIIEKNKDQCTAVTLDNAKLDIDTPAELAKAAMLLRAK
ncbi:MAG: molybdenum cofactor cytidylyltransferase [Flavobacteriales bacterium]|jgi:molybdenum cofactor cytidylyltransferase